MKIYLHCLLLVTWLICTTLNAEDNRLTELEMIASEALSQMEMNITSGEVAIYLDNKLTQKESKILKKLDEEGVRLFTTASKLWHEYRQAQVVFEGDKYRGGSIQPLVRNLVFTRLTKERLAALSLDEEIDDSEE